MNKTKVWFPASYVGQINEFWYVPVFPGFWFSKNLFDICFVVFELNLLNRRRNISRILTFKTRMQAIEQCICKYIFCLRWPNVHLSSKKDIFKCCFTWDHVFILQKNNKKINILFFLLILKLMKPTLYLD